jgi:hypothetical protein
MAQQSPAPIRSMAAAVLAEWLYPYFAAPFIIESKLALGFVIFVLILSPYVAMIVWNCAISIFVEP